MNFWESAKIVAASLETKSGGTPAKVTAIPFYFLASHAAELLLKSALLKRGFPETDLRKFDYRHNLDSLLRQLREKGVFVTPRYHPLDKGAAFTASEPRPEVYSTC